METNDTVIYVDFTKDELDFIDSYAKANGEDTMGLLQRLLKKIIEEIRTEVLNEIEMERKHG